MALLEIQDLSVEYRTDEGPLYAVDDFSLSVDAGETVGIVGESGCGKTTATKPVLGMLDENGAVTGGRILLHGEDITHLSEAALNERVRWKTVSYIPQNAMAALDPVFTVGEQVMEVMRVHEGVSKANARRRTAALFEDVGVDPSRIGDYPHELSGGQRQRVTIALALALEPDLIIADEPTTGLDVVVQDAILDLIREIQAEIECGLVFISHDMSTVGELCDRIAVVYAGRVMETGTVREVFSTPAHPYTIGLRNAFPTMDRSPDEESLITIPGSPPDLHDPPTGCRFADRCPFAEERCEQLPARAAISDGHVIECHFPERREEFRERGGEPEIWSAPGEVANP